MTNIRAKASRESEEECEAGDEETDDDSDVSDDESGDDGRSDDEEETQHKEILVEKGCSMTVF